jgi:predicted nucleic acid-binding Zn ribbon protein
MGLDGSLGTGSVLLNTYMYVVYECGAASEVMQPLLEPW